MTNALHPTIPTSLNSDHAFATLIRGALAHMFPINSIRLACDDNGSFIICEDDAGRDWSLCVYRDGTGGRAPKCESASQ